MYIWSESILGPPSCRLQPPPNPRPPVRRGVSCVEPLVSHNSCSVGPHVRRGVSYLEPDVRHERCCVEPPVSRGHNYYVERLASSCSSNVPKLAADIVRPRSALFLGGPRIDLLTAAREVQERFKGTLQLFIWSTTTKNE